MSREAGQMGGFVGGKDADGGATVGDEIGFPEAGRG